MAKPKIQKVLKWRVMYVLLAFVLLIVFSFSWSRMHDWRDKREGNRVVEKVEQFHVAHGRYPVNLGEMGIEEKAEGPFYQWNKENDSYEVWFGRGLGESFEYQSTDKRWDNHG